MSTPDREQSFAGPFMDDYFAECEDHLAAVRHGLLALESTVGSSDPPGAILEQLFRSFHSVKGLSAMVELREAERLSHEMESCLRAIRQHEVQLSSAVLDALIDGVQVLELVIAARRGQSVMPGIAESLASLADAAQPGKVSDASSAAGRPAAPRSTTSRGQLWNVTFTPSPALVARGIKVDIIRSRLGAVGQIQSVTPRVANGGVSFDFQVMADDGEAFAAWRDDGVEAVLLPQPAAEEPADSLAEAVAAAPREMAAGAAPANFVRVDLARLDDLMRLVGELVVTRARLEDTLLKVEPFTPAAEWRALQEHTASIERQLRDLREGVMRVRLVPVGEIFRRMPFVVRDLAQGSRQDGPPRAAAARSTEIDKFLIERMMDPVLHLVRNAVSHGIEPPRRADGGRQAARRHRSGCRPRRWGSRRCSKSATTAAAWIARRSSSGRARPASTSPDGTADARALLDVLCAPGFSTRDAVDRASGRGVGMAVVATRFRSWADR